MNPRPMRLYDFPFSGNGYKVRLALAQLGIVVEHEIVDLLVGETRTPEFLAKSPLGQIPVLQLDDGTLLRESNAILFWLTEHTELMPHEALQRTQVIQWMMFEQSNIDKVLGRTRFLRRYPNFIPTSPRDWVEWDRAGNQALSVLEAELRTHPFLVGDRYSAADICLYGYVHCADEGGFDLNRYPFVSAWLERVRRQPGHVPMAAS